MIEQAIKHVAEEAVKRDKPELRHIEGDPDQVRRVFRAGEDVGRLELDVPNRRIKAQTIGGFATAAAMLGDVTSAVFYTADTVEMIVDTGDGYERVALDLVLSREAKFILDINKAGLKAFAVQDLRDVLRYTLYNAYDDPNLIKQVSNISFKDQSTTTVSTERGKESLGKDITQEVMDSVALPNEIQTFNLIMWANIQLAARFPVQVILDPNPAHQQWIVAPIQESVDQFIGNQLECLGVVLAKSLADAGLDAVKCPIHNCTF